MRPSLSCLQQAFADDAPGDVAGHSLKSTCLTWAAAGVSIRCGVGPAPENRVVPGAAAARGDRGRLLLAPSFPPSVCHPPIHICSA